MILEEIQRAISAHRAAESAESAESQQPRGLQSPQVGAEKCGKHAESAANPHNPQAGADSAGRASTTFPHNPHNPQARGADSEKSQPDRPTCTPEWFRSQGAEVDREDLGFIKGRLPIATRRREAVLLRYVDCWLQAMAEEPVSHRQENAGRYAANCALREGQLDGGQEVVQ